MARIYFDNASTTWPKPETVYLAVDHALRHLGVSIGRGHYQQSVEVRQRVEELRDDLAKLIHAPSRRNIAFTFSCTDSLSTAIGGLVQPNDHVVTSVVEHNSVLRPLAQLELAKSVSVTKVTCNDEGAIDPADVIAAMRPETRLVVLTHASNVTGTIQELATIGKACQHLGVRFLIDAAQTIGSIPVNVKELGCDLLAASGHKGLLGPLGTGFLYYSDEIAEQLSPLRFGGTGNTGRALDLPSEVPEKFEAGSLNMPGLLGLSAGLKFLVSDEGCQLAESKRKLAAELFDGLNGIEGVKLYGPTQFARRLSVFPIQIEGFESNDAANVLETNWSIQTRAGLHCAPLIHRMLETESSGGLIRISPGLFSTEGEVAALLGALKTMVGHR